MNMEGTWFNSSGTLAGDAPAKRDAAIAPQNLSD